MSVRFRPFRATDVVDLQLQASQHFQLGLYRPQRTREDGEQLRGAGPAWTGHVDGKPIGCAGMAEAYAGRQALLWALLSPSIGAAHLAVTRFAREAIAKSPYRRVEAIVRADCRAETTWCRLVGLSAAHVLRAYGALSETHILFELVRE